MKSLKKKIVSSFLAICMVSTLAVSGASAYSRDDDWAISYFPGGSSYDTSDIYYYAGAMTFDVNSMTTNSVNEYLSISCTYLNNTLNFYRTGETVAYLKKSSVRGVTFYERANNAKIGFYSNGSIYH